MPMRRCCCGACPKPSPRLYCKTATLTLSGVSGAIQSCFGRLNASWLMSYLGEYAFASNVLQWYRRWYISAPNNGCLTDHSCFNGAILLGQFTGVAYTKLGGDGNPILDYIELGSFGVGADASIGRVRWYCSGDNIFTRSIVNAGIYGAWTNANVDSFTFNIADTPCFYADGMDDSIYSPDYDLTSATVRVIMSGSSGSPDYGGTHDLPFWLSSSGNSWTYSLQVDSNRWINATVTSKQLDGYYTSCHPLISSAGYSVVSLNTTQTIVPAGGSIREFKSNGSGWSTTIGSGTGSASFV